MVEEKDLTDYKAIPAYRNGGFIEFTEDSMDCSGELSLEDTLQFELSMKYIHLRESVMDRMENLKTQFESFKEENEAYLQECRSSLRRMDSIPEDLKIDLEVVSCCHAAVKLFEEKTKFFLEEIDREYETDLVKASLTKQKYLQCFKSRIECEKSTVEEGEEEVETYRLCTLTVAPQNTLSRRQYYGKKSCKKKNIHKMKQLADLVQEKESGNRKNEAKIGFCYEGDYRLS
ncbi:uncharacterized protein CEXT_724731 [Caerostris extrusa]|uniref:Uncharacterized protein n=1 Tax=Caerostris extrusa TaxID=172846 RepID=A0AAV4QR41_CAEEX|nr:uncharacterized protein CEXT_724731 [Caerostris extrusa]